MIQESSMRIRGNLPVWFEYQVPICKPLQKHKRQKMTKDVRG